MNRIITLIIFLTITLLFVSCDNKFSVKDAQKNLELNKETFVKLEQYIYVLTDSIFKQNPNRKILFYHDKKEVHVQIYPTILSLQRSGD